MICYITDKLVDYKQKNQQSKLISKINKIFIKIMYSKYGQMHKRYSRFQMSDMKQP